MANQKAKRKLSNLTKYHLVQISSYVVLDDETLHELQSYANPLYWISCGGISEASSDQMKILSSTNIVTENLDIWEKQTKLENFMNNILKNRK